MKCKDDSIQIISALLILLNLGLDLIKFYICNKTCVGTYLPSFY